MSSCAEQEDKAAPHDQGAPSGWQVLADGSIGRLGTTPAGDPRAVRCWVDAQHDCVWLSERRSQYGRILVAGRTVQDQAPAGSAPTFGYSCAIYPDGAIEQRIARPGAGLVTRWEGEKSGWPRREIRRLLAEADLSTSDVVECSALRELVGSTDIDRLFDINLRRAIAPAKDSV